MEPTIEVILSGKGGVGKSTITAQRAFYKAIKKKERVLLIDMDMQGAVSLRALEKDGSYNPVFGPVCMSHLFIEGLVDFKSVSMSKGKYKNLSVLPTKTNDDNARNVNKEPLSILALFEKNCWDLFEQENFDSIIIDTPPGTGTLQDAAIAIGTHIFLVTEPTYTETLIPTKENIRKISKVIAVEKNICGIIVNRTQSKSESLKKHVAAIDDVYGSQVLKTKLKDRTAIKSASESGYWIGEKHKGDAVKEILELMAEMDSRVKRDMGV